MSREDNYSVAGRYRTVRKHLDSLGYKQALSLDSLPLIELLLVDLSQTKESLKHFQSIAKDNLEACSQLQTAIDPYKCDNARLVQECNQLHLELIETKEANQKQSNEYKKRIRKLESELNDLQLSFSKNLHRIKQLEVESSNKSKKILELQGKCCKPIVNNVNLATKKRASYPLRRPVLECEPLPRSSISSSSFNSRKVEPYVVDFVSMADHRISCLNNEVTKLKEELFVSNEYVESLKSKLNSKDKEISRLRTMLEGGRPCTSINKDHCCLKSEKLNGYRHDSDIEELLQAKLNLEGQLKESLNKQHDAMAKAMKLAERNEELEKDLKDVDRIALAVEADCNSTVKENNRRVCRLQEKLEDVMTQVHVLESELTVQRREAQELRADLEACRLEKSNVQRTLESTLEEKKQMTDRINNLKMMATKDKASDNRNRSQGSSKECSCQKEENDDIPQRNINKTIREKNIIIESLQNTIERLESERDHYKSEYFKYKDQLKKDSEKDNNDIWSEICELRAQLSEKDNLISKLSRDKKELCQEKFNLESKLQNYQSHHRRSTSPCNFCRCLTPPLTERKSASTNSKIERLERERDTAKADVQRLIEERDALRERLKESRRAAVTGFEDQIDDLKEELNRTKQELSEQRTQYFQLRTLQDQTDQALGDVQSQLTQCESELTAALDRNKNLERQQLQQDNRIKELMQEISTHRSSMSQIDREKDQLLMDLDERTEKIAALEREIVFKDQQMSNIEQQVRELSHTKEICMDQASDMERQMRSMQLDMENLRRQLSSVSLERENAIQENRRLADDLASVSCELRNMHKDLEAAKIESHDLKRQLQTYVKEVRRAEELLAQKENERTDMLNHFRSLSLEASVLENNNHSLETEAAEARGALQSARDQISDLERQLSDKECLIRGYEAQITELTQNIASLEIQLQTATEQRIRAEEDLRTVRNLCMTLEQQKECISQRLQESTDQKTHYELQLARYRSEQDIFQEQLNKDHKTIDRLEKMLEDARKETMTSQTNSRDMQCEVSRLKQKISDLQSKLTCETGEVRKYQTQAAEYSKQISDLRRQVTNERFERAKIQEEGRRCSKDLIRLNQQRRSAQSSDECSGSCMCGTSGNETSSTSEGFKIRITEVPCSTNQNCHCFKDYNKISKRSNDFNRSKSSSCCIKAEAINKVCYCSSGKTKIGEILAGTKNNKNIECKKLNMQKNSNKQLACCDNVVDETVHCERCGGRKQRQNATSPDWIKDTLNLVNKLVEEKKKARMKKLADIQNNCDNMAVNVNFMIKQDEATQCLDGNKVKLSEEGLKTKHQSLKYSLIETCAPTCVSTQTLESIITISDISRPHLLKILQEIQQYAQNIEQYFRILNETMKQSDIHPEEQNESESLQVKDKTPAIQVSPEQMEVLCTAPSLPIPSPLTSKRNLGTDISNLSQIPYASTPQGPPCRSIPKAPKKSRRLGSGGSASDDNEIKKLDSDESTQYLKLSQHKIRDINEKTNQPQKIQKDNITKSFRNVEEVLDRNNQDFVSLTDTELQITDQGERNFIGNVTQEMYSDESTQYLIPTRNINYSNVNNGARKRTHCISNARPLESQRIQNDNTTDSFKTLDEGMLTHDSTDISNLNKIPYTSTPRNARRLNPKKQIKFQRLENDGSFIDADIFMFDSEKRTPRNLSENESQNLNRDDSTQYLNPPQNVDHSHVKGAEPKQIRDIRNVIGRDDSTQYLNLPENIDHSHAKEADPKQICYLTNMNERDDSTQYLNLPENIDHSHLKGADPKQIRDVTNVTERDDSTQYLNLPQNIDHSRVEDLRQIHDMTNVGVIQPKKLQYDTTINVSNKANVEEMSERNIQNFLSDVDSDEYLQSPQPECSKVPEFVMNELNEVSEQIDTIQEKIDRLRSDVCADPDDNLNNRNYSNKKRKR